MKKKIESLAKEHQTLKFEKKTLQYLDEPETIYYEVSGFEGNKELILSIDDLDDFKALEKVLSTSFCFIEDYFGVEYEDKIDIALRPVNNRTMHLSRLRLRDKSARIDMNFFKNTLEIEINYRPDNSPLVNLMNLNRMRKAPLTISIKGYKKPTINGKGSDIRNILNSVLFDFGYSYNLIFEPINLDSLARRSPIRKRNRTAIPEEKINIVYKEYIPELIEYFNIGEKVDYPPFRFICYFHIVEYFSDKSAYFHAAKRLKALLLKPDFHINTDKYVNQAINFFKIESTKNTSDKVKIRRVLGQFINREDFEEYLKDIEAYDYFTQPCVINCSKPLNLSAINFESDSQFQESLMKRIYSMRCSIVHSNPDFDETKAIPFSPTVENMYKLRKEMDMIFEVARTIIVESTS